MQVLRTTAATMLGCVALATTVGACGGDAAGGGDGEIVIGASLPLSGPFGGGGAAVKAGYDIAVKEVNAGGGLDIGGKKRKVKLRMTDNRSSPTTSASQAREAVLKDGAVALLGSLTPILVNPEGSVAEREKVPLVTSLVGGRAFIGGNKAGWKYYWNLFPDEKESTAVGVQLAGLAKTNKRVAVITSADPDGQTQGPFFASNAKQAGYDVVYQTTVPTGTQDFSAPIRQAKGKDAQVLFVLMGAPDGAALFKQMRAAGFRPKVAICQTCASLPNWPEVAGSASEGTTSIGFWSAGGPDSDDGGHLQDFLDSPDAKGAAAAYSTAKVLFDAMQRAKSTDPDKVNAAIETTDLKTPFGQIKFAADHLARTDSIGEQWQGGKQVTVFPSDDKAAKPLQSPPAGL